MRIASVVRGAAIALLVVTSLAFRSGAQADPLLDEIVEFTGPIFYLDAQGVPAAVIGAVRNGEMAVYGFGERAGPGTPAPDGGTVMRIGSTTPVPEKIMLNQKARALSRFNSMRRRSKRRGRRSLLRSARRRLPRRPSTP